MTFKIKFLGTGGALGVPKIRCSCNVCSTANKKEKNTRNNASVLITHNKKNFLIDTPPEIRSMLTKNRIHSIDAVFITHTHYDHLRGLNVLNLYEKQKNKMQLFIPLFAEDKIKNKFERVYHANHIQVKRINETKIIDKTFVTPIQLNHGPRPCQGYIFSNKDRKIAYLIDFYKIFEKEYEKLTNLDLLIIESNFLNTKSKEHINIDEAINIIKKIKPKKAIITHISHEIDYYEISKKLEKLEIDVTLAYDNMEVEI